MFILGLNGSPRRKGNTSFLLSAFLKEAEKSGANTQIINVASKKIVPCNGCATCEKTGVCIFDDDDMSRNIYNLIREAHVIVAATPMYFYNATSQFKTLIDRTQALWVGKYKRGLIDPGRKSRLGFLLALGATKGKNLFQGIELTAKYFFDAVGASYNGSLTYRSIENSGDMEKHPTVSEEIKQQAEKLLKPLINRKRVLFLCNQNACRSQMASAFTQYLAGDKIEAISGGSNPGTEINDLMAEVMEEKGIDMGFRKPKSIEQALSISKPNIIVTMGCKQKCPIIPGVSVQDWNLPEPAGKSIDFMRDLRDEIEKKVVQFTTDLTS